MRIECDVELDSDDYDGIDSVRVTCSECQHQTESYGRSPASVRRCLALMREECPRGENNYYVAEEDQE